MLSKIKSTVMVIALAAVFISIVWMPVVSAAPPPVTTVNYSQPNYGTSPIYVNTITDFTLTSVDDNGTSVSNIWYSWNANNYTKYTGAFNAVVENLIVGGVPQFPIDLEGLNTLYYNATDDQGNAESPKSIQVYVDDRVPITSIDYIGEQHVSGYQYLTSDTEIRLSASDIGSGLDTIYYSIDDGSDMEYSGVFSIADNGRHTVNFYAEDNLGNQESKQTVQVYVDDVGPTVSITTGSPSHDMSGTVYVTSESLFSISANAESGIHSIKYNIDSGSWLTYSTTFSIPVEASHTIRYYATDNLGHVSTERSLNLVVDDSSPTILTSPTGDGIIEVESGTLFYINCTDAPNGVGTSYVYYSLNDGESWKTYYDPILIEEDMSIIFYGEDILGNDISETTYNFEIASPSSGISNTAYMYLGSCLITVGLIIVYFIITRGGDGKDAPSKSKKGGKSSKPKKKTKRNG
ncbi:MAG: hypothetical protein KAJ64_00510 [Thermoplasmata archaeon]|nr:hypothetical protein [Thermoplasmata archaeon]